MRELIDALSASATHWRRWAQGPTSKRRFELSIAEHALTGTLDEVFPDALLQFRAGKAHGRNQLRLGLDALIWSALGETRPIRRLILGEGARELAPVPADVARQALSVLIDALLAARQQPLPFMPKAAFAYAELADRDEPRAWRMAAEHWRGREGFGEGQDRWVRLAGRGQDLFADPDSRAAQDFRRWARRIFDPLLAINSVGGVP
jgi:exodeoxyribonuclease V gamma subunit